MEGEATQEPAAPEGAAASPPTEDPCVEPEATPSVAAPALDWSHVRGFQAVEPAPEPMASSPDYAEELAKELSARAARFALSVDESLVLSSDGVMRWLGDPVARIVAGDDLLRPRAVLLADEALTGEERGVVENRAALWLVAHVRKGLGPLLALSEGSDLPEAARTLGAAIVEALGVLERDRMREAVRALDQTARGALRKLGVRFGSLYIYVPILLKPGPRGLCTLLWTLRRGTEAGADRLLAFASAGRTSFGNEGLLSPDAYRVAGFRLCGERVVRVDIIERLSDLIRAAMPESSRAGARASTFGFAVTPQMTSLTGCSGEAFASILRSLGFESVKVDKAAYQAATATAPTEPLKPLSVETEPNRADAEHEGHSAAASEPSTASELSAEAAAVSEPEPPPTNASDEAPEALTSPSEAPEPPEAVASAADVPEAPEVSLGPIEDAPTASAEDTPATPNEEVEIWRPAPRRPRAAKPGEREGRRRPDRPTEPTATPDEARPTPARAHRPERRDETSRRAAAKEEGGDDRRPQKGFAPRRDSRPVDPDSPFAKLAALKPLLERRDKRP